MQYIFIYMYTLQKQKMSFLYWQNICTYIYSYIYLPYTDTRIYGT